MSGVHRDRPKGDSAFSKHLVAVYVVLAVILGSNGQAKTITDSVLNQGTYELAPAAG